MLGEWKLQHRDFKVSKYDYHQLLYVLQDIIIEAKDLESVTINNTFSIEYFLGDHMKFLALVCGIDSATCTHSCIWCKCPKEKRLNMELKWSISVLFSDHTFLSTVQRNTSDSSILRH